MKMNTTTTPMVFVIFSLALFGSASAQTSIGTGQAVTGLSGTTGTERVFKIAVPAGRAKLEIKIYGGSGDADLYVKRGSAPSTSSYDYRPYVAGNTETVTVPSPASGDWYIKIRAYSTYSGLTLVAAYTGSTATVATPFITPGSMSTTNPVTVSINCSTSGATIRYTTTGSEPTSSSTVYVGSFTLSSSATVKARAFKSGMADSQVTTASYTISVATALSNSTPTIGLGGAQGNEKVFKINCTPGQSKLTFKIWGGTGDCDLYVKRGSAPTTASFDYRPYVGGNTETVKINTPASGDLVRHVARLR